MKVVLWNPRAAPRHQRLPLSVLFVARGLPDRHPWVLVDGNLERDDEALLDSACTGSGVVLLVSVMPGPQLRAAVPVCRALRRRHPGLVIVWGGYFPSIHGETCVRDGTVDIVVEGPGEQTIVSILDILAAGGDPAGLPGVGVRRAGTYIRGSARAWERGSAGGLPPYERLDMDRYAARTFLGRRTFNHHSSHGCPYHCNFCAVVNLFDGRWLADPTEDVLAAVEVLVGKYGADAIEFHDNNFFAWERRTAEIAAGMTHHGISWWGEGRVDTMLAFSGATWEAMARSGLRMVFYGAESGDQEALDRMNKGGLEVRHTRELNRLARRHGITPEFSFVLGNPGNPARDVELTLELVRELKRDNPACEIIFYLYTPVPLPGMFDDALAGGFGFPKRLDDWISDEWGDFSGRRNPRTPWMTDALRRRVRDFETVLHARHPSSSDLRLSSWQRRVLSALAAPRARLGLDQHPWEIRLLQRAWGYRRPEEMGF